MVTQAHYHYYVKCKILFFVPVVSFVIFILICLWPTCNIAASFCLEYCSGKNNTLVFSNRLSPHQWQRPVIALVASSIFFHLWEQHASMFRAAATLQLNQHHKRARLNHAVSFCNLHRFYISVLFRDSLKQGSPYLKNVLCNVTNMRYLDTSKQ